MKITRDTVTSQLLRNRQESKYKSFVGGPLPVLELNMVYNQLVRKCHWFYLQS